MSKVPANLKYIKSHEWVETLADGTVKVGITDHAQYLLGDMVYVDLPQIGRALKSGQECAVVESVKAASDVYSPITGEVVAVNEALAASPELVNKDSYGEGWIMRLKPANPAELDELLDADAYAALIAAEAH